MIQCRECGKDNGDNSAYCFSCGALLGIQPALTGSAVTQPNLSMNPIQFLNRGSTAGLLRTPTGIDGLDAMISGGIPKGRVVLVAGGPGTGKTTLTMQFLVNGCQKYGEPGVFVSLDEPGKKILEDTLALGWDLKGLVEGGKIGFIEPPTLSAGRFSIEELVSQIKNSAATVHAQRIALDPLTYVSIHYPDIVARRKVILNLFNALAETGATCLVSNEMRGDAESAILLEEYLADGVFRLHSSQVDSGKVRTIDVEKMRGTVVDDQPRAYVIGKDGIRVVSDQDIFTYAASLFAKEITGAKISRK